MTPVTTLYDAGGTTVKLSVSSSRCYLWLMQPSDIEEGRYAPAESVMLFLTDEQVGQLGAWLIAQVKKDAAP